MCHKNIVKKGLLILSILLLSLFNQPTQVRASGHLDLHSRHHVDRSRDRGDAHRRDGDKRDDHRDQHQDEHHGG